VWPDCLLSTTLAADIDLHGFGREVWRSKSSEAHVIHLKAPPALRILVGGETLELERTTCPTSSSASGAPFHSRGDAGNSIYLGLLQRCSNEADPVVRL
jgi:hypothetical protein